MTSPTPPTHRPRRLRRTPAIRRLVRETRLSTDQLVLPLFVHDHPDDQPIDAMPGQHRWSPDGLLRCATRAASAGLPAIALFPKIQDHLKTRTAQAAHDPAGLIPRIVARLKQELPDLLVITDVALDPYNADGHDGLVTDAGEIDNDSTLDVLCQQAVTQANAGADIIAPSDMMDGRVAAIRHALDAAGHPHTPILAYTAKYASAFYGPFRSALDSKPRPSIPGQRIIPSNKSTYQMDPANAREALREAALDIAESADILMVKPALAYLDILHQLRLTTDLPLAAYHVSGEYAMLEAAAAKGWLDRRAAVLECLTSIARAGADLIFSYHALEAAAWLTE